MTQKDERPGSKPIRVTRHLIDRVDKHGHVLESFVVTRPSTNNLSPDTPSKIKEDGPASPKKDASDYFISSPKATSSRKYSMPSWMIALILIGIVAAVVMFKFWLS